MHIVTMEGLQILSLWNGGSLFVCQEIFALKGPFVASEGIVLNVMKLVLVGTTH
jgi:hypothetical protein